MDISKATPRPWEYDADRNTHDCVIYQKGSSDKEYGYIEHGKGGVVGSSEWIWLSAADAALIVLAVNSYESMQAENARLRKACHAGLTEFETLVSLCNHHDPKPEVIECLRAALKQEDMVITCPNCQYLIHNKKQIGNMDAGIICPGCKTKLLKDDSSEAMLVEIARLQEERSFFRSWIYSYIGGDWQPCKIRDDESPAKGSSSCKDKYGCFDCMDRYAKREMTRAALKEDSK